MLVVPAAGCGLYFANVVRSSSTLTFTSGLTSFLAVLWAVMFQFGLFTAPASVNAGNWLELSPSMGLTVPLTLVMDQQRALFVLAGSLIVLLETVCLTQPNERRLGLPIQLMFLYPLSILAILSSSLVVVLIAWILTDGCIYAWHRLNSRKEDAADLRFNPATFLSFSSALLMLSLLMTAVRFQTFELNQFLSRAGADDRVDATTVISGLHVVLVAAIIIRSSFFPAMIWSRKFLESMPHDAFRVVVLAGILPGITLATSIEPLGVRSPDGSQLLGMLGLLTSLAATGVYLAQGQVARCTMLLSISAAGLSTVAFASGHVASEAIAGTALFCQLIAVFVLSTRLNAPRRGLIFSLAMAVAVSGIGGSNAILSSIELARTATGSTVARPSDDGVLLTLWWGVVISQFLWGAAIGRLIRTDGLQIGSERTKHQRTQKSSESRAGTWMTSTAVILSFAATLMTIGVEPDAEPAASSVRLFLFGAATPACLLGTVVAWLVTMSSSSVRDRVSGSLESLINLGQNWYYLHHAFQFGIAGPFRCLAWIIEAGDRTISGSTSESGWKKTAVRSAGLTEFLRHQPATYYGLTIVLVVTGLMWSLL